LDFARRRGNVLAFLAGFLYDAFTLRRIDDRLDLALQVVYLAALTALLLLQNREHRGLWRPGPRLAAVWRHNVEALHFLYGGLLSPYVVLYSKSGAGAKPLAFFVLLVGLLLVNEMPALRRAGFRLRLGLHAFCTASFLIYFVPLLAGRVGGWTFALALGLSAAATWALAGALAAQRADRRRLFLPAGGVLVLLAALYSLKMVPPVPLSVKFQGVYHAVRKSDGGYTLVAARPPFWLFWRRDSRPFFARPGDEIHYFAGVFAPRRFRHRVRIRWGVFDPAARDYVTTDVFPMEVTGGRDQGFRGTSVKANHRPGRWRVTAETEDGRAIGRLDFEVLEDPGRDERTWRETRM
jgi:hypothetical protein